MIKLSLEHSGYGVETASDGSEGLKKFGDGNAWDLVVLDHRMPGMSGLDLQARLNADRCPIPTIFITAHGDEEMRLQAMRGGAVEFLPKPFDDDLLVESVRAALER